MFNFSYRVQLIGAATLASLSAIGQWAMGSMRNGVVVFLSVFIICLPLPAIFSDWGLRKRLGKKIRELHVVSAHLEKISDLARVDTLLFPYRGVLTKGHPHISELIPEGMSQSGMLSMAAAAERSAKHPFGRVIYDTAIERGLRLPRVSAQAEQAHCGVEALCAGDAVCVGTIPWLREKGVHFSAELLTTVDQIHCRGDRVVALSMGKRARGLIALHYDVPDDVRATLSELSRAKYVVAAFTSAPQKFARALKKTLGIAAVHCGLPVDKQRREAQFLRSHGQFLALLDTDVHPALGLREAVDVHLMLQTNQQEQELGADFLLPSFSVLPSLFAFGKQAERARKRSRRFGLIGALLLLFPAAGGLQLLGGGFLMPHLAFAFLFLLILLSLLPLRSV